MKCSTCAHENPGDSVFCEGCGDKLESVCAACGASLNPGARFCRKCGAATGKAPASLPPTPSAAAPDPRAYTPKHLADRILQSRSALEGERKQVTVLFADVKGSMELAAQLDP